MENWIIGEKMLEKSLRQNYAYLLIDIILSTNVIYQMCYQNKFLIRIIKPYE